MSNNGASGFGIGLLVGAAVGLAVGFLYAPRPGKETRAVIREKAETLMEKAKEKVARVGGKAEEAESVEEA